MSNWQSCKTLLCVSHGFNCFPVYKTLAPAKRRIWQQAQQTENLWSADARQWHGHPITMETGSWLEGIKYHSHGKSEKWEKERSKIQLEEVAETWQYTERHAQSALHTTRWYYLTDPSGLSLMWLYMHLLPSIFLHCGHTQWNSLHCVAHGHKHITVSVAHDMHDACAVASSVNVRPAPRCCQNTKAKPFGFFFGFVLFTSRQHLFQFLCCLKSSPQWHNGNECTEWFQHHGQHLCTSCSFLTDRDRVKIYCKSCSKQRVITGNPLLVSNSNPSIKRQRENTTYLIFVILCPTASPHNTQHVPQTFSELTDSC